MEWFMVAMGGGIGAVLRYSVIQLILKLQSQTFWATLIVNLIGSFFMGITMHHVLISSQLHQFFTIGVLGGFTTFSTFAFDIVTLVEKKEWVTTSIYMVINLLGGILAFIFGWLL